MAHLLFRSAAVALCLALAACVTTSTVHQPLAPASATGTYGVSFASGTGDDADGIARLERVILLRMHEAGVLAPPDAKAPRAEITITHYSLRGDAARLIAGILAGRDRIASQVRVIDPDGRESGHFDVETTNLTAMGSREGLMERHADEIIARLRAGTDP